MLEFKKVELEDREQVLPFIRKHGYCSAEYCFGNLYIWQSTYHTEYAVSNRTLIIRGQYGGKRFYQVPLGGEGFRAAVEELMRENPEGLLFYGVTAVSYTHLSGRPMGAPTRTYWVSASTATLHTIPLRF